MKKKRRSIILIFIGLAATLSASLPLFGDIGYEGAVGTLNLELEDSENETADNRPVGTLGLSLEGSESEEQETEAVGTLQLELEDSEIPESETVGTLELELEGSEESENQSENPFSVVTDELRVISIPDLASEEPVYETESEEPVIPANENESISQAASADLITETEENQNAGLPEIVNKPAKTADQITRIKELSETEKLGFFKAILRKSGLFVKRNFETFNIALTKMLENTGKVSKEKLIGLNPPVGHKYEVCPEKGLKTVKDTSIAPLDNFSVETERKARKKKQKATRKRPGNKKKLVKKQKRGTGTLNLELESSSPAGKGKTTGSLGLELE